MAPLAIFQVGSISQLNDVITVKYVLFSPMNTVFGLFPDIMESANTFRPFTKPEAAVVY